MAAQRERRRHARGIVATHAASFPGDESLPSNEELQEVLDRPEVQAALDRYEEVKRTETLRVHFNDQAHARPGLPPLSGDAT